MTTETIQKAIEYAKDANASDFKDAINSILADKVSNYLHATKAEIASQSLGDDSDEEIDDDEPDQQVELETETEDSSDEEV